ncbi:MAG: hypothetical protein RL326_181 [Pseudomonadota bacterium]|jgi:hypothetical protein
MSSDLGYRETHLLGLANEGGTPLLKRLALVVNDARGSHTVNMVRELLPTFVVQTLAELRGALTECFNEHSSLMASEAHEETHGVVAIDMTTVPLVETALFASHLRSAPQFGILYILTPKQFDLFEDGTFDFVVR